MSLDIDLVEKWEGSVFRKNITPFTLIKVKEKL